MELLDLPNEILTKIVKNISDTQTIINLLLSKNRKLIDITEHGIKKLDLSVDMRLLNHLKNLNNLYYQSKNLSDIFSILSMYKLKQFCVWLPSKGGSYATIMTMEEYFGIVQQILFAFANNYQSWNVFTSASLTVSAIVGNDCQYVDFHQDTIDNLSGPMISQMDTMDIEASCRTLLNTLRLYHQYGKIEIFDLSWVTYLSENHLHQTNEFIQYLKIIPELTGLTYYENSRDLIYEFANELKEQITYIRYFEWVIQDLDLSRFELNRRLTVFNSPIYIVNVSLLLEKFPHVKQIAIYGFIPTTLDRETDLLDEHEELLKLGQIRMLTLADYECLRGLTHLERINIVGSFDAEIPNSPLFHWIPYKNC